MIQCAGISSNPQSADLFKEKNNNFEIIGCKYSFLIWDSGYLYFKMSSHIKILLLLAESSLKLSECHGFIKLSEENIVFLCDKLT